MRDISKIIIHCSATPNYKHIGVNDIDSWHKARGWRGIGYHYVILTNGNGVRGRNKEEIGAHCKDNNADSIGICMIGTDQFSREQWFMLRGMVRQLEHEYPGCTIHGHREFNNKKTCPGFNVTEWLRGDKEPLV
jgi:N-acetylmuramoyl-L-alanine amidase